MKNQQSNINTKLQNQKSAQQKKTTPSQKPATSKMSQQNNSPKNNLKSTRQPKPANRIMNPTKLQQQLHGAKTDASGLRFEQVAANFFRSKGWNPQIRVEMLDYEYDLFSEYISGFQKKYLVVECKHGRPVSAKDIVHFMTKVDKLFDSLNVPYSYSKPEIYAYLCYTSEVDTEAEFIAKRHYPPVQMVKLEE